MAGPTAVVDIAFPAKSWISFRDSVVNETLLNGRPCSASSSSGARALPASEMYYSKFRSVTLLSLDARSLLSY
jgi:hypothetical protein